MSVREELPNAHAVDCIVALMFVFDALMPLVKHLLSGKGVSQVLTEAGELEHFIFSDYYANTFPEIKHCVQGKQNRSGDLNPAGNTLFGGLERADLRLVLNNDNSESWHRKDIISVLYLSFKLFENQRNQSNICLTPYQIYYPGTLPVDIFLPKLDDSNTTPFNGDFPSFAIMMKH